MFYYTAGELNSCEWCWSTAYAELISVSSGPRQLNPFCFLHLSPPPFTFPFLQPCFFYLAIPSNKISDLQWPWSARFQVSTSYSFCLYFLLCSLVPFGPWMCKSMCSFRVPAISRFVLWGPSMTDMTNLWCWLRRYDWLQTGAAAIPVRSLVRVKGKCFPTASSATALHNIKFSQSACCLI